MTAERFIARHLCEMTRTGHDLIALPAVYFLQVQGVVEDMTEQIVEEQMRACPLSIRKILQALGSGIPEAEALFSPNSSFIEIRAFANLIQAPIYDVCVALAHIGTMQSQVLKRQEWVEHLMCRSEGPVGAQPMLN
jgi:hypothetical protein